MDPIRVGGIVAAAALLGPPWLTLGFLLSPDTGRQAAFSTVSIFAAYLSYKGTGTWHDVSRLREWGHAPLDGASAALASALFGFLVDLGADTDSFRRSAIGTPATRWQTHAWWVARWLQRGAAAVATTWSFARLFHAPSGADRHVVAVAAVVSLLQLGASFDVWHLGASRESLENAETTLLFSGLGDDAYEAGVREEEEEEEGSGGALLDGEVRTKLTIHRQVVEGHRVVIVERRNPQGPPAKDVTVVLLHGYGAGSAFWAWVMGPLAKSTKRVIAIDWLGSGASSRPVTFPGFSVFAPRDAQGALLVEQWLYTAMERCIASILGPEPGNVVVAAHSLGGLVTGGWMLDHVIQPPQDDASK